jgi:DnaJ-class molecular chaperone
MSTGHDTKCKNCHGAGEREIRIPRASSISEIHGMETVVLEYETRIVECMICTGTGLVEVDEYWEHG